MSVLLRHPSIIGLLLLTLATPLSASPKGWELVWSDEFNGPNGSAPDPQKWKCVVGGDGFGNHELQYYTSRPQNVFLREGNLVIQARREDYLGRAYTSARLNSSGRFAQRYGRLEARIKIPQGQGIWPAFWMLGQDRDQVSWPDCGEIDIMENVGKEPSSIHGTLHGPGYSGGHGLTSTFTLPPGQRFCDDFHVFGVEWGPQSMCFSVDSKTYKTLTPADLPPGKRWVFDHPFYLLLNVAVGGDWPGPPDSSTAFPQTMLVDYVRAYQSSP